MIRAFVALSLLLGPTVTADDGWRIYAGGHTTAWRTTGGHHGHDADCPPGEERDRCESHDFSRGNLDNSIGFRTGAERRRGWLTFGAELGLDPTEYNISQRDFSIGTALLTAGAAGERFGLWWGLRAGAGLGFSTDGHTGGAGFAEGSVDVPISGAVALRVAHRESSLHMEGHSLRSRSTSYLLVFSGEPSPSQWTWSTAVGISSPGLPFGEDLELSRAPFWRFTASRGPLSIGYVSLAHESTRKTDFMGYPDNERGKTINGIGVDWRFAGSSRTRVAAGVELADWSDSHGLLQSREGEVRVGIDVAAALKASAALPVSDALALIGSVEQLYWTRSGLAEARVAVGLGTIR